VTDLGNAYNSSISRFDSDTLSLQGTGNLSYGSCLFLVGLLDGLVQVLLLLSASKEGLCDANALEETPDEGHHSTSNVGMLPVCKRLGLGLTEQRVSFHLG